jgi:3-hydroxyisobutyrate dehydrogenase-like beta-hydroxyacid dehydrogenase
MGRTEGTPIVGVVGLGAMGSPIAGHVNTKGCKAIGYDVSPEARERAEANGVECVDSLAELRRRTEAAILLVGQEEQVLATLLGDDGLFAQPRGEGSTYRVAIADTVSLDAIRAVCDAAPPDVSVVDIPLVRTVHGAIAGTSLALFGGTEDDLAAWTPILDTFCADIVRLGDVGMGQIAKTLNNYVLWACMCANAEAMEIGGAYGCDLDRLHEVLAGGTSANWALDTWQRKRGMPWAEDDMRILEAFADGKGLEMPFARATTRGITDLKRRKADLGLADESVDAYVRKLLDERA